MHSSAFRLATGLVLALATAACDAPAPIAAPAGPAWLSIVDRPLTRGDTTVTLHADGRVIGDGIEGVWEERDGKYCRTLTRPEAIAGTECQSVSLEGDSVTFDNGAGRSSTWVVQ